MEKERITSQRVVSNFIWSAMERFGAYIVSFVVSLVLARIFADNRGVYGTIAIVTAITAILQVFIDSGLGTALVQKKDADNLDFSTVFWFNLGASIILYIAVFFLSPLISSFYKGENLIWIIRVLSLTIIISACKNVLQAYVSRKLLFKKFFFATLIGTITAAIAGIFMALKGFGAWALVAQHLINLTVDTFVVWIMIKWKPNFKFSFSRFKTLFKYGWKILCSRIVDVGFRQFKTFVIGFKYSDVDLALYNRGEQFPDAISTNINTAIDGVLLPTMSKSQSDISEVKQITRKSIKLTGYTIFPLLVILGVCAPQIIRLLLSEKWLDCVPYLQIFCFVYAFYPINTANLNAIKAIGRSGLYLILDIIVKVCSITIIIVSIQFGVLYIALSGLLTILISRLVYSIANKLVLKYDFKEQICDILGSFCLSLLMGAIIYGLGYLGGFSYRVMLVQILIGFTMYIGISIISKNKTFNYIVSVLKKMTKKD